MQKMTISTELLMELIVDIKNRLETLEKSIEKLEFYLYGEGDLSAIHGQIDNLNRYNDILENDIKRTEMRCLDVEKELENYRQYKTSIEDLETDVMHLKEHIKQYHELMLGACPLDIEKTIRENMKGKSPFKCPVCEGFGRRYADPNRPLSGIENAFMPRYESGLQYRSCHACEGKGVVWV